MSSINGSSISPNLPSSTTPEIKGNNELSIEDVDLFLEQESAPAQDDSLEREELANLIKMNSFQQFMEQSKKLMEEIKKNE